MLELAGQCAPWQPTMATAAPYPQLPLTGLFARPWQVVCSTGGGMPVEVRCSVISVSTAVRVS